MLAFLVVCRNITQHLIGPYPAGVDDAAPNRTGLPKTVVTLVVFEAQIKGHRHTDGTEWSEGDEDVDVRVVEKIVAKHPKTTPSDKNEQVLPGKSEDDGSGNISMDKHGKSDKYGIRQGDKSL